MLLAVGTFYTISASERLDRADQVRDDKVELEKLRDEAVDELVQLCNFSDHSFDKMGAAAVRDFVAVKKAEAHALKEEIKALTQLIINE